MAFKFVDTKTINPEDVWEPLYPSQTPDIANVSASLDVSSPLSSLESPPQISLPQARLVSHSRRQQKDHVSRPPNAFMLFRSDFWAKEKQKEFPVERNHRDISRIAGHCWNNLDDRERARYQKLADQRKQVHTLENPGYRYAPTFRRERAVKRTSKKGGVEEEERCKKLASLMMDGVSQADLKEAMKDTKKGPKRGASTRQASPSSSLGRRHNSRVSGQLALVGMQNFIQDTKSEEVESLPSPAQVGDNSVTRSTEDFVPTEEIPELDLLSVKKEEEVRMYSTYLLNSSTF